MVAISICSVAALAWEAGNLDIGYDEKSDLNSNGTWATEVERRLAMPEYASKAALVSYVREEHRITLTITDEGKGFDWREYMEISPARATHNHGRGIALSKMMSFDHIEYRGAGNEVVCWINFLANGS